MLKSFSLCVAVIVIVLGYWQLAFGTVVLNGTKSLEHNGYYMLRYPLILRKGMYVTFVAPDGVRQELREYKFIKRIAGVPGDQVHHDPDGRVCVDDHCRKIPEEVARRGHLPLKAQAIPEGYLFVVGDSVDSLDSRYEAVGLIAHSDVVAAGWVAPLPSWKEIERWFD